MKRGWYERKGELVMDTTRVNMFGTSLAQTSINPVQLKDTLLFLINNRQCKLSPAAAKTIVSARPLTVTPLSMIYDRAIELHKESKFSFMQFIKSYTPTPELMTYTHVTLDLLQMSALLSNEAKMVVTLPPELIDTIVLNVTTLTRRTGELNNTTLFQSCVVRDLLSRSYYNSKASLWLSPSLLEYMCKFYNMSMSSSIASVYNLTYQEQQSVATVFSIFFMQKVSDATTAEILVKNSKINLGPADMTNGIINKMKEVLTSSYDNMTLDDVCRVINQLGITRLDNINRKFLYTRLRNVGPDSLTSYVALEYPAYWCYLILLVLSGRKMGLTMILKNNDLNRGASDFVNMLMKSPTFYSSI